MSGIGDLLRKAFRESSKAVIRRPEDLPPSEPFYRSTRSDIQIFLHSAVWEDIKSVLEERFVEHMTELSGIDADLVSRVAELQGRVTELDHLLHLPERIILELEEKDGQV